MATGNADADHGHIQDDETDFDVSDRESVVLD